MCGILFATPLVEIEEKDIPTYANSMLNLGFNGLARSGNRGKDGGCGVAFFNPKLEYKINIEKSDIPLQLRTKIMEGYKIVPLDSINAPLAMLGHMRYATSGEANPSNRHPVMAHWPSYSCINEELKKGPHGVTLAMVVNGETWIQPEWEERIKDVDIKGATCDSAKIAGMIVHDYSKNPNLEKVLSDVYDEIFDYGMIAAAGILVDDKEKKNYMFWMVDGGRPLCEAYIDDFLLGISETVYPKTLKHLGENNVKSVTQINGGIIKIQDLSTRQIKTIEKNRIKPFCFFEKQYFQDHLSTNDGKTNASYRRKCGGAVAKEHPIALPNESVEITAVPNSGNSYAHGFAAALNLPIYEIVCRSPLKQQIRTFMVSQDPDVRYYEGVFKFETSDEDCFNKVIVIIDDSIVRFNNLPSIVQKVRAAGASEVHVRIGCPPIISPCYSGVNMLPSETIVNQLNLNSMDIAKDHGPLEERLKEYVHKRLGLIKIDSVGYLSVGALEEICGPNHCFGCIKGEYPYKFKGMEELGFKFVPVNPLAYS